MTPVALAILAFLPNVPIEAGKPPIRNPGPAVSREDADRMIRRAITEWAKRRSRVEAVEYALKGEESFPKGCLTERAVGLARIGLGVAPAGEFPPENYVTPIECRLSVDFSERRVRFERSGEVPSYRPKLGFESRRRIAFRDGNRFMAHEPALRKPTPDGRRAEFDFDTSTGRFFEPEIVPLLLAHGHLSPAAFHQGGFAVLPEAKNFEFLGTDMFDGRDCIVLRTRSQGQTHDLWVDLEREAIVLRLVTTPIARASSEAAIHYTEGRGVWLPSDWIWWQNRAASDRVVTFRVASRDLNADLSSTEFAVQPKPGDFFIRRWRLYRYVGPDEPPTEVDTEARRRQNANDRPNEI